ncbi:MAG TPA: sigma-70 family RNA polymerase sigma factor [Candidatus Angelobacter sp.]
MNKQLVITDFYRPGDLSTTVASNLDPCDSGFSHLLEGCLRSHDELLWSEFIRRSQPVIAGVVIKTLRRWGRPTSGLVDDLVQETYLKLFADDARALRRFVCHHENALYGFLKVVASNTVQDHFRSSYSQKRGCGREEESIEQSDVRGVGDPWLGRAVSIQSGIYHGLERRILLSEIDAYLRSRASEPTFERDYTIFWLYYREGLTAKAISRVPSIGLTVKGVESTLLRLTRLVRNRLQRKSVRLKSSPAMQDPAQPYQPA